MRRLLALADMGFFLQDVEDFFKNPNVKDGLNVIVKSYTAVVSAMIFDYALPRILPSGGYNKGRLYRKLSQSKYFDDILEVTDDYADDIIRNAVDYADDVFKNVDDYVDDITDSTDDVMDDIIGSTDDAADGITGSTDDVIDDIADSTDDIINNPDVKPTSGMTNAEFWKAVRERYGRDISDILESFGKDGRSILEKYGDEIVNAIKNLSESEAKEAIELIYEYGDDAIDSINTFDEIYRAESLLKGGMKPQIDNFLENVIDETGNLNSAGLRELRLAIQKGVFSSEDIGYISKSISKMGLTEEFETALKNGIDFGKYLRNIKGEPPADMVNPHAHHILFKTGNGAAQQELVKEGQAILRKYGIDPIVGPENIVWAPNGVVGQHDYKALERIVSTLKELQELGTGYEDIVDALSELGDLASLR